MCMWGEKLESGGRGSGNKIRVTLVIVALVERQDSSPEVTSCDSDVVGSNHIKHL